MSLGQTAISIRPRAPWESLDLGFAMARRWYGPLVGLWLLTSIPVALALVLTLGWDNPWGLLLWWWLKPLYEWPLVNYLSQRVFNQPEALRSSLASLRWPSLSHLLPYLLWRRFSPIRGFSMPVGMLEGLRGSYRRKRVELLARRQNHVSWLLLTCVHFEAIVPLSLFLGFVVFFYDPVSAGGDPIDYLVVQIEHLPQLSWLTLILEAVVIAPFYIAAAFAAYLSRRTQLEAWDLELIFRQLSQRIHGASQPPAASRAGTAALLLLLTLGVVNPWPQTAVAASDTHTEYRASDSPQPPADPAAARQLIGEVKQGADFDHYETEQYWRYRDNGDPRLPEAEDEPQEAPVWVGPLAQLIQILLWLGGFALLIWLLRYLFQVVGWIQPPRRSLGISADDLDGELLQADEAPLEILAQAQAALAAGHYREALSLTYRASLMQMIKLYALRVPVSATEGECRQLVAQSCPSLVNDYFSRLTRLWVQVAYAHRQAKAEQVGELLRQWSQVLDVIHPDAHSNGAAMNRPPERHTSASAPDLGGADGT